MVNQLVLISCNHKPQSGVMGARFKILFYDRTKEYVDLDIKMLKRNRSSEDVVAVLSGVLSETGLVCAVNMKGRLVL